MPAIVSRYHQPPTWRRPRGKVMRSCIKSLCKKKILQNCSTEGFGGGDMKSLHTTDSDHCCSRLQVNNKFKFLSLASEKKVKVQLIMNPNVNESPYVAMLPVYPRNSVSGGNIEETSRFSIDYRCEDFKNGGQFVICVWCHFDESGIHLSRTIINDKIKLNHQKIYLQVPHLSMGK